MSKNMMLGCWKCASTCIASKVAEKEPIGLSRAWMTALSNECKLLAKVDSLNCWIDIHHTPKLQIDCTQGHKSLSILLKEEDNTVKRKNFGSP